MYKNIPAELKALPQWVCWRAEDIGSKKPTKVPYDPKTGKLASVTDPSTWNNFDTVINAMAKGAYSGIGLVFTDNDPYTFIDLDDTEGDQKAYERQVKVYREFDSYSEVSPSGKGLHIIVKGAVKSGRRRSYIEVYSSQRYATMTGNIYNSKPIHDRQDKLTQLWEQMGSGGIATYIYSGDQVEKETDYDVTEKAKKAANADKFVSLLAGKWEGLYSSQSEADFAFIDIIAFYTQNRNQIIRIFRSSPLGQRDKAKRTDYLTSMINRSFDRMLPPIDIDGFKNAIEDKISAKDQLKLPLGDIAASFNGRTAAFDAANEGSSPSAAATTSIPIPPGLMGEIARFIYQSAPRPVPEIALAGALGLMAGIAGRAYNISGSGLNQYVLLIAQTGAGKEAIAHGIDKLMNAIRSQVPTSNNFIGPSEIASGQALIRYLSKGSQCFVSILGEFGIRLQQLSNQFASTSEMALRRMLLDLYQKSGHGQVLRKSVYADRDKNIDAIESPAFSIIGESTPDTFYGVLNEEMITEGLLPRFVLIEYAGKRPALNSNHLNANPSFQLIDQLAALVANAEIIMHEKRVIDVQSTPEATRLFDQLNEYADKQINSTDKELLRHLWNRAHLKALKIAALIAVGVNMSDPIITAEYVEWATNIVYHDIKALTAKFEGGEIGGGVSSEGRQAYEIIRIIKDYIYQPWDRVARYCDNETLHRERIIPYAYINRRCTSLSPFRNDKMGATNSIKRSLQTLIESDKLREFNKNEMVMKYGTTQRAFVVSNLKLLD